MKIKPNWIYRFYAIEVNGRKYCDLLTGSLGSDIVISRKRGNDYEKVDISQIELGKPEYIIAGWATSEHGWCAEHVEFLSVEPDHFVYRQVFEDEDFERTVVVIPYREVSEEDLEEM